MNAIELGQNVIRTVITYGNAIVVISFWWEKLSSPPYSQIE